jgi:hypothetical protein
MPTKQELDAWHRKNNHRVRWHDYINGVKVIFHKAENQAYSNAIFSAGLIENHPIEKVYIKFERFGEEPETIVMRRDEALALMYSLIGALWSDSMIQKEKEKNNGTRN